MVCKIPVSLLSISHETNKTHLKYVLSMKNDIAIIKLQSKVQAIKNAQHGFYIKSMLYGFLFLEKQQNPFEKREGILWNKKPMYWVCRLMW